MYCARMYVLYACYLACMYFMRACMYVLCAHVCIVCVHVCIVCARACMFLTQIFYTCESSRIKTNVALVNPITSVFCNATNISTMNATGKTPHQQCMLLLLSVFSPHATFIRVRACFLFICR